MPAKQWVYLILLLTLAARGAAEAQTNMTQRTPSTESRPESPPPPRFDPDSICWNNPPALGTPEAKEAPATEPAPPAGFKHASFHSTLLDREVGYNICLPPNYDAAETAAQRYPVVYWLHGSHGNENLMAGPIAAGLEEGIKAGRVPPMIYVFVNGGRFAWYMDWPDNYVKSESMIVRELIPHIDATYRTIASREGRGIEGFSMGGAGALKFAFKYPDMFSSVISVGGALLLPEQRLEHMEAVTPATEQAVRESDIYALARQNAEQIRGRIPVRLYIGTADPTRRYHDGFVAHLLELGIEHELLTCPEVTHIPLQYYQMIAPGTFECHARNLGLLASALPAGAKPRLGRPAVLLPCDADVPWVPGARRETRVYRTAQTEHGPVDLLVDLYLPREDAASRQGRLPVVLFLHGGGWTEGTRYRVGLMWLLKKGYAFASIDYRYSQEAIWPAQMHDAKAAVRWLRAHAEEFHLDGDRIAAAGISAGAQLAAILGTSGGFEPEGEARENAEQPDDVAAVVDFFGPAVVTWFVQHGYPGPITKRAGDCLMGGSLFEHLDRATSASASSYVTPAAAPFFIVHGTQDPIVPVGVSRRLHQVLRDAGVESQLIEIEGGGHGDPGEAFNADAALRQRVLDFLDQHVKNAPAPPSPRPARLPTSRASLIVDPFDNKGPKPPEGTRVERDVTYRIAESNHGAVALRLDLFLPPKASTEKVPIVLAFHGGGWAQGSKLHVPLLWLTEHGYAVASAEYRFTQEAAWPAALEDCRAAAEWLAGHAEQYGIDPQRMATTGFSSGGQLASLLGLQAKGDEPFRIRAVADYFGANDLTVLDEKCENVHTRMYVQSLVRGRLEESLPALRAASATTYVTPQAPPFLIVHGLKDPMLPPQMSRNLQAALEAAGVESTLVELDAGHGDDREAFFTGPVAQQRLLEFLGRHLKAAISD